MCLISSCEAIIMERMDALRALAEKFKRSEKSFGTVLENESMARRTTMRAGGAAPLLVEPASVSLLVETLRMARAAGAEVFVVGGGSNLVVSDEGFESVVVSTRALDKIDCDGKTVTAGAGTSMARLVDFCAENSLSGLEAFAGLPGTVGGAAWMNARCFDVSVSDVFESADCVNRDLTVERTAFNGADWSYKKSPFQNSGKTITSVSLRVSRGDKDDIKKKCGEFVKARVEKGHFKFPSAGSVFKNNRDFGKPSGALIDEAGLRGRQIGGAQIAPWHGNFIINKGGATCADVKALVALARSAVKERFGFSLETEIIFCGKGQDER